VFIGVSNSQLVLKQNDKRIYNDRLPDHPIPRTSGTISYDL